MAVGEKGGGGEREGGRESPAYEGVVVGSLSLSLSFCNKMEKQGSVEQGLSYGPCLGD